MSMMSKLVIVVSVKVGDIGKFDDGDKFLVGKFNDKGDKGNGSLKIGVSAVATGAVTSSSVVVGPAMANAACCCWQWYDGYLFAISN